VENKPVTFDAARHEYRAGGVLIPSVTQVCKEAGLQVWAARVGAEGVQSAAMNLGSMVHLTCELYDRGTLDEAELDPALVPYLAGWKAFLQATGWKVMPEWIEQVVADPAGRFAGTLDRVMLAPIKGKGVEQILVDIKTGAAYPWHKIQSAAYTLPLKGVRRRVAVYLNGEGGFKMDEHPQAELVPDQFVFQSALAVCQWKRKHYPAAPAVVP